jgi:hypothetical protein
MYETRKLHDHIRGRLHLVATMPLILPVLNYGNRFRSKYLHLSCYKLTSTSGIRSQNTAQTYSVSPSLYISTALWTLADFSVS